MKQTMLARLSHAQRHRRAAVVAICCILASAGWSAAGDRQPPSSASVSPDDVFAHADSDHDGRLSRGEAGEYLVYLVFAARDRDHDRRLTKQEWAKGDSRQLASFRERDYNRDDVVTLEEAILYGRGGGGAASLMRAADKNRDGKLDRAELHAYLTNHTVPTN
jgi:hypothetical protein